MLKADGARARLIKAPAHYEPIIPASTTTVVPVVSARALGRPLGHGIAHRPELLCKVMGVAMDEPLLPAHVAALLSSERGSLQGVGDASVVPLINMVDDPDLLISARKTAELALAGTTRYSKVVLASMKERRLVDVIS